MKFFAIAATAIALAATPAAAGGWGGSHSVVSPQFANASAMNLAVQSGAIKAIVSKGSVKQVTGASAEAINKSNCGCKGSQEATAHSKNVSFQVGTITPGFSVGSINQSAVSTSLAKNVR
jgi:hypothetical protein